MNEHPPSTIQLLLIQCLPVFLQASDIVHLSESMLLQIIEHSCICSSGVITEIDPMADFRVYKCLKVRRIREQNITGRVLQIVDEVNSVEVVSDRRINGDEDLRSDIDGDRIFLAYAGL